MSDHHIVSSHCMQVSNDVTTFDVLSQHYPDKLKRVFYEKLVSNLLSTTKMLYSYLDLAFSDKVVKVLEKMTSKGNQNNYFATERINSLQLAFIWRLKVTMDFVQDVDKHCRCSYQRLGYRPVTSERILRNISVPFYSDDTSLET